MSNSERCSGNRQKRVKEATVRLGIWTFAWLISLALATFGPLFIWDSHKLITIIAILINLIFGIGVIIANKNHLAELDELQQKITLNAMAITLGVGLIAGLSYSLLDVTNIVSFDAEISHLVTIMGLTYAISTFVGHRKYS
ncbi:MAG: hypothetical protein OQJ89_13940 [Kangiellaceae bacterium]|nr:hypothetical protein [Kangiellaceae bacterium]MCW9018067.1 hypothetical protein [Kangiellaceae bacterium]